jgi:capsular polysaccharide biosynthesis protein
VERFAARPQPDTGEELLYVDLQQYLRVLRKWRSPIVLFTVIAVVTSGVFSFFILPPVYEAKAVLLVTQPAEKQPTRQQREGLEEVVGTVSRLPQMTVNTYVGQIKTEAVLERVIKKLSLDPVLYTPASLGRMVKIQAVKDTNLIEIRVQHSDAKLAADIANTLAQEFLNFISESNQQQMAKSVEFLEQQRQNVRKELAKAAAALKEFDSKPRGVDLLKKEVEKRMADLTDYQSQLNQAKVDLEKLEAARAVLAERLRSTPPTVKVQKPLLELGEGRSAGPAQTVTAEEVNPVYVSLQQSLAEKEAAIAEKEAQVAGLRRVIAEVEKGLEELQAELTAKSTERTRLAREVQQLEEAEALLAQKITEAKVARSLDLGEATLLLSAPALVPAHPVKPNKRLNLAVAAVVGLVVSGGLALLMERLDVTVRDPEDLERRLGLAVLGTIPEATARTGGKPA